MYRIQGADQKEYGPITADQVRQWIGENRLNRFTLCAGADGLWKPLGQFLEFADVLNPGPVIPGAVGAIPPQPTAAGDGNLAIAGREQALARVKVPALCLIILAALSSLWAFALPFQMRQQLIAMAKQPNMDAGVRALLQSWSTASPVAWGFVVIISLVINGVIIFGALRMMKLRSYGLSLTAAVVSLLPCGSVCCCLGIAFGVWAAITLNRPDVKAHFQD